MEREKGENGEGGAYSHDTSLIDAATSDPTSPKFFPVICGFQNRFIFNFSFLKKNTSKIQIKRKHLKYNF